jgi:hypothetical protein
MKSTLTGALVLAVVVAGCSATPSAGASPSASGLGRAAATTIPSLDTSRSFVLLDFEGTSPLQATTQGPGVRVDAKREKMPIGRVTSGDGSRGLRFPHFSKDDEAPRMVLVVQPEGTAAASVDPTSDGGFTFGADVKLDRIAGSGKFDNGDNVVQRGLFADPSQYKLQVDKRVPSCTVKSPLARAFVKVPEAMEPGWYRVVCDYRAGTLTVSASRMENGQPGAPVQASVTEDLGPLVFNPATPLVVGGKVGSNGLLVRNQPDQFNGALDNVFVAPGL